MTAGVMSGLTGVMDWCPPLRLKLMLRTVFLLISTRIVRLHGNLNTGANHNLTCVNDYLFTINCSLTIPPSEDMSSYWLAFKNTNGHEPYECPLTTNTKGDYFCSIKTSMSDDDYYSETFTDTDTYEISLCHSQKDGSPICPLLDDDYTPVTNIKPNTPCCLTVSHNSSQYHFTWRSTYEEYSYFTSLPAYLQYQLRYYKRGDTQKVTSGPIDPQSCSVDDKNFEPGTKYAARVRSSPNQVFYMGEWSEWSAEVHWKTEPALNGFPTNTVISELDKRQVLLQVFIPFCVMVLLVLLLCYAPVKKWRQSAFIPTPAPYFHTLYSDCQGDFKSWVVTQETAADMLKAEETLHIDTLTKCADVQEEERPPQVDQEVMEGCAYGNMTTPVCDTALLGIPYAVSTMTPLSAEGSSQKSLTLSFQSGSTAGDSGCWLCSDTSLEKDPPWYCNEYCTLSAFQQSGSITAEHHGSL